ncbi:MAG: methyltransferase domain-containing protein, partial [Egibacteraceae bacterium]
RDGPRLSWWHWSYRNAYVQAMRLDPSARILDLGCGTGVVARALARDGHAGQITAVDQSPVLLQAGRRLAAEEGVERRIEFRAMDVHALDLADEAFDAVIANTLVSHVTDPLLVLEQAARVLRPTGVIAVFDGDYASLTYGCSDPALGEEMEQALLDAIVSKPRVMRDLPRLLRKAGLRIEEIQPHLYADIGTSRFFLSLAETYVPLAARDGLLAAEEVDAWLADQRQSHEEGTFFAACSYYAYIARRHGSARLDL